MNKHALRRTLTATLAGFLAFNAHAGNATPDEAVAMVKSGVAAIKANREMAFAEITGKHQKYIDRDLYLTVWALDGMVRAHGASPKMVGRNLIGLTDIDGKKFIQERMALAKASESFWQDYQFRNPASGKIEPKRMYCERLDDMVVCGGVYK